MRDQVFTGKDVAEAVQAAAGALGIDPPNLKYVVLDRETPGRPGRSRTPARIAVLLGTVGPDRRDRPDRPMTSATTVDEKTSDPPAEMKAVLRAVAEAAGIEVSGRIDEGEKRVVLRIEGPDAGFFHDAELHQALDYLLQRMFGHAVDPKRLVLECEGYRESRDAVLVTLARELASAVRADGQPRQTRPLNSYERRIIHVAIGEEPGLRSFSVGEGLDRRVTIAPNDKTAELAED